MTLSFPEPVRIYFTSENAHDGEDFGEDFGKDGSEALARCFAVDAVVQDEGHRIQGLDAIKAWRIENRRKYAHTVEPLGIAERDGKTVVTASVSGNFPGSPVVLDHVFGLDGDRIMSLEIR